MLADAESAARAEIDARPLTTAKRFKLVSRAFDNLRDGESLKVILDHEPLGLRRWLGEVYAGRYIWTQRNLGENYWQATVQRTALTLKDASSVTFALRSSWTCSVLTERALERLSVAAVRRSVAADETVAAQGENWAHFGVVTRGSVIASVGTDTGREYTVYESVPFDLFAEVQALDAGAAFARFDGGVGGADVLVLPRDLVLELADDDGRFARRLATTCAQRVRRLHEILYAQLTRPTIARLAAAILPYAVRAERAAPAMPPLPSMTQTQLARAAGTVKDVTGRDLATLASYGAIELRKGKIVRIDETRLRGFLAEK